jgi:hypothetical protein
MAEFVFTSPGVKFRERDLSFVTRNVGVTTLGVVGETLKGPAFEPVFVQDADQFRTRFGGQSTERFPNGELRYQLPYVANAYLAESNQLFVTRVLGLSGYDAGKAWAITLSAGVDPSTTGATSNVVSNTDVPFSGSSYLGVSIFETGSTGTVFTGFTKNPDNSFSGIQVTFTATTYNSSTGVGTVDEVRTELSGSSYTEYENMVLAVLRSRASVEDLDDAAPQTIFNTENVTVTANNTNTGIGDLFGQFTLTATPPNNPDTPEDESVVDAVDYVLSIDPNAREYVPNVLGTTPKGKNTLIWVEAIYGDLIRKLDSDGIGYGINSTLIEADTDGFTNYREQYVTPETPWVVSELRGNDVDRLFKFVSISDGDAANAEIKISIQNIDPISKEFDIIVRDFNDRDDNIIVLESFTRCTMRKGENNFIGRRIGTTNGDYTLRSEYIMLELNDNAEEDSFPAGFEGYIQKDWSTTGTGDSSTSGVAPKIIYKTEYDADDRLNRNYLGLTEKALDTVNSVGTGINQNIFNYQGQSSFAKSKGFHMDSGATGTFFDGNTLIGEFEVGAGRFRIAADIRDGEIYADARTRKFTLVPAGGFDGWDEHRQRRSNTDLFRKGGAFDGVPDNFTPSNDFQAWETAIETFNNPEEVTINLFATPGINWSDNLILVENTIEMIEQDRTDSLYIIDSPDIDIAVTVGERADVIAAEEIVDLLEQTAIDSSYSCTYFPWIQIQDTDNNQNVFIPPTGEVVKAMAFTDNVKFPWFAPAGLQRGTTDARRSKYRMSLEARDIVYAGRINPMADFNQSGTAIFGQKTLQVRESALDRINVRRLLLQIKVLIANIATRLVFEQNDQTTIDEFLSKANPVLDSIRRERGLEEFRIKMDDSINTPETRDRNELFGEIFLKPTKAVEFIGITFTITPSGASFDDIDAA